MYLIAAHFKRFILVYAEMYQVYIMYRDLYFTVIRAWICNMVTSADVRIIQVHHVRVFSLRAACVITCWYFECREIL